MKITYTLIASLIISGCSVFKADEQLSAKDVWIKDAIIKLKSFKPGDEDTVVKISTHGNGLSFSVFAGQLLKDTHGNWAYFVAHYPNPQHAEIESSDELIIDVALAIDNKGNIYRKDETSLAMIGSYSLAFRGKDPNTDPHSLFNINRFLNGWHKIK